MELVSEKRENLNFLEDYLYIPYIFIDAKKLL